MEPYNLLQFWRGVTGDTTQFTTTMNSNETEVEKLDEGPFFDLEFKTPVGVYVDDGECSGEDDDDSESSARINSNLSFSSSNDNLFFKGRFLQIVNDDEILSKTIKRKSSVFKLGFKKPSAEKAEKNNGDSTQERIKVEEEVPIISLFTRQNSLRNHFDKQSLDDGIASEDKKLVKGVVQKYMKMIKPLYLSVSKRYEQKSNGSVTTSSIQRSSPKKYKKEYQDSSGLRVVCKHLGKSRSASNFAAVSPVTFQFQKQDDSMFQQEDGIQNAILHCKKSFNSPRDSSLLPRSTSDPSHEKSIDLYSEEMDFFDLNEAENEEYFDL